MPAFSFSGAPSASAFSDAFGQALSSKLQRQASETALNTANAAAVPIETQALAGLRDAQARGQTVDTNRAIAAFDVAGNIGNAAALRDINTVDLTSTGGARSIYGGNESGQFGGSNFVTNPLITDASVAAGYGNPYKDLVEGRANGGMVGGPMMDNMDADYDLFRKAAATAQVPALDKSTVIKMMAAIRAQQMQNQMKQPMRGYADGGTVDTDGMVLDGPGTERSDSIPAVVDGERPAALSKGEMVIPKNVVEYYGTKHFDTLLEKARMAMKKAKKASSSAGALR